MNDDADILEPDDYCDDGPPVEYDGSLRYLAAAFGAIVLIMGGVGAFLWCATRHAG